MNAEDESRMSPDQGESLHDDHPILPFALYRQGYEYYWKTHAHPNSTFKHNVLIYLCVDVNGEVKDLHSQFNIIYIMRTNINQGRIQSLAVHDCSAH